MASVGLTCRTHRIRLRVRCHSASGCSLRLRPAFQEVANDGEGRGLRRLTVVVEVIFGVGLSIVVRVERERTAATALMRQPARVAGAAMGTRKVSRRASRASLLRSSRSYAPSASALSRLASCHASHAETISSARACAQAEATSAGTKPVFRRAPFRAHRLEQGPDAQRPDKSSTERDGSGSPIWSLPLNASLLVTLRSDQSSSFQQ